MQQCKKLKSEVVGLKLKISRTSTLINNEQYNADKKRFEEK